MSIKQIHENDDADDVLAEFKDSVILLQGIFEDTFFDVLKKKKTDEVFVLEGRPSLDAARFSCRGLIKRKMKPTLIADNMAGFLFFKKLVKEVWVSYQVADHQGALCQIGGMILGVLGKRHKVPVNLYPNQRKIKLIGHQNEIFHFNGTKVVPDHIKGYVPLVEWVPRKYITRIYE